ncbi:MAG: helix-turn-helix domain-containing protein [Planctomycetota bacterium]|jgi:hypothetical protein
MRKKKSKPKQKVSGDGAQYLMLPYSLLGRRDITLATKCIFRHIYGWGLEGCWQSNETIAKILGIGASTVSHSVNKLHKMGVVYLYVNGTYRRAWAVSNPEVREVRKLCCRGAEIPKAMLRYTPPEAVQIGQLASKNGQQSCPNRQDIKIVKNQDKNTHAPPTPLPAKGQASAVLEYHCGESPIPIPIRRTWWKFQQCQQDQRARLGIA